MAEIPKVPEDQFRTVIKALLQTPPKPMAEIPRKRKPKKASKKRG